VARRDLYRDLTFPDHFGFANDSVLLIDKDRYLVITEFDIKSYTEVWKDIHRFDEEDFARINTCRNIDKIYENGEFRAYFVHKE
jgi:virulence-associated protein VagC